MQTKTLIQASTNILRVTNLAVGDVIKIVEDSSYSSPGIFYGVVLDLLNTGEKSYFQVLRYKKEYSSLSSDIKTYAGDKDVNLFPATVEEIKKELGSTIESMQKKIEEEEKKLLEKKAGLALAIDFINKESQRKLRDASFKEITQKEYEETVKLIG